MVLSDGLVEEIYQTLVQAQALIMLQHKTVAQLIAKLQAEAAAQQQQKQAMQLNDDGPQPPPNGGRSSRKADHA